MREEILSDELKRHFENAGFVNSNALFDDEDLAMSEGVFAMNNSFGLMAGLEVLVTGDELEGALRQHQEDIQSWIRKALMFLENKKGLIVDGYLLLILQQEPNVKMKEIIREIELNTKVCRKHVVWPVKDGTELGRLQFITVLALPEPLPSNASNGTKYELSAKAKTLITEYRELKSLDRVLDAIKQGAVGNAN